MSRITEVRNARKINTKKSLKFENYIFLENSEDKGRKKNI
jgi:hypothetical protein